MEMEITERKEQQACVEKVQDEDEQYEEEYVPTTKGIVYQLNKEQKNLKRQFNQVLILGIILFIIFLWHQYL
ncbi:transmembrane protein, putative (macronuclear) [Tetrahymena thermophila SB210]|uniref:Transmembrane protein, putative n=1 Tax=Tetrahymena thermophila (strain SB210) TaxID=312017 RepID=W7X707_TETTS|nr:transmembrane protein, putative [Tetrahymena thermophila SB210]EWS73152.1 transmembrane protein, putative [Tetrahymena thermophila SB210]|eukprot:XP_012654339.1 transmembrane protein, putative [Tetrahymena thermophila SB210]